ncbi:hypothetical protein [Streptomyces sedi]|uniref:Uncharacterized protein n=1 Tax=Streptomyces sedi TaxID=555059 RepID=A0A5C4VEX9_9ACTN|nr:hypothetical protein [Streptomyces sedi]TNM34463.1 hypothetical protein FH715_01985 [Streptomyces sedi]
MESDRLQAVNRMILAQRVRLAVNQYEISEEAPGGGQGELIAFAQQKRLALKERVTFWHDTERSRVFGGFAHRQVVDLGGTYDVTGADGETVVGTFSKDFKKSLTRSTWHLDQPGLPTMTGSERNKKVAVARRVARFIPVVDDLPIWAYHFDFHLEGTLALSVSRKRTVRDRYLVEIHEPRLDRRLVVALAVALDAMQGR